LIFSLILLFFETRESPAQNTNLEEYLFAAEKNNAKLKEQFNILKISNCEENIIEAQYKKTTVNFSADIMHAPVISGIGYDEAITNKALYSAQIIAVQPLFTGKKIKAENSEQENIRKSSENLSAKISAELQRDVSLKYIQCVYDRQILDIQPEIISNLQFLIQTYRLLSKQGLAKETDVKLTEIETASQFLLQKQYKTGLQSDFAELNRICGISDTTMKNLSNVEIKISEQKRNFEETVFSKNYSADSTADKIQQMIFESKYNPTVNLYGSAGLNAVDLSGIQKRFGFYAGINLSIPIYDGSQKKYNSVQTDLKIESLKNFEETEKSQWRSAVNSLKNQILSFEDQIKMCENKILKYNELSELYKAELKTGQISAVDYIKSIHDTISTKTELLLLRKSKSEAIIELNYLNQ
jgi:outer membrane protein TolC